MRKFTIKPLVLAMAVAAIPAVAQAQDGQILEEVIVTGSYRDSLANALNQKRNATGAVDAIMAEDIADFPDLNLAESLQRIPGVAITRAGGEGRQISVRGLGPDFTRVRINGMEAVSTTGGTDSAGGTNRGRGFDFNTFSSDLFSSLIVRKTNSAEIEEGSLGATVELKAAQPFDYDGFVFTASGQLGFNDLAEEVDPTASFLVSNIFADGMVGALFSLSYSDRTVQDEGFSTVRWSNLPGRAPYYGSHQGAAIDGDHEINQAFRPRIPRYDSYLHEVQRLGASTSIQFRPTDVTEISFDVLYSKHEATRSETFMQGATNTAGSGIGSNANINVVDYRIENNGLVYAELENVRLLSENRYDELSTEFTQFTLSATHEVSDRLRVKGLVGHSKSDHKNPIQNTVIMRADAQTLTWDFSRGGNSYLTFGDGAYDAANWTAHSIRQRPQYTENTYDAVQASVEFDLTDNLTLKGGISYKDFSNYGSQSRIVNAAGAHNEGDYGVDISDFITTHNSGLGDGRAWLVPDGDKFRREGVVTGGVGLNNWPILERRQDTYGINEETIGAWVQLDFNGYIGDTAVRGDIGFRYFDTDQQSTAWENSTGDWLQYWIDHSYDDILPSVNLAFEPSDNVVIRLGYSEGIARAGVGSLKSDAVAPNVTGTNLSISSGGNPTLEPTRAKSYDFGVELYFDDESMLATSIFYKDIESHIQTLRGSAIGTSVGITQAMAQEACNAGYPTGYGDACNENLAWNTSMPLNGPGGDLYGFEISYQQPFTFLPSFWSNFGFIGSFTYVKSQMDYLDDQGNVRATLDLMDMSTTTRSATLYYEQNAFSARVSLASRDDYLTGGPNPGNEGADVGGVNGTTNIDAAASYQLNDNIKFTFEALNLTNEPELHWIDSTGKFPHYYHETGRQYFLGVQYKY